MLLVCRAVYTEGHGFFYFLLLFQMNAFLLNLVMCTAVPGRFLRIDEALPRTTRHAGPNQRRPLLFFISVLYLNLTASSFPRTDVNNIQLTTVADGKGRPNPSRVGSTARWRKVEKFSCVAPVDSSDASNMLLQLAVVLLLLEGVVYKHTVWYDAAAVDVVRCTLCRQ